MKTYISILRGINVSGHRMIKMKDLQGMYERLGFTKVRTYIQSGNVVFENKPSETAAIGIMISGEIRESFGFDVPVIVLAKEELTGISAHNAFILDRNEDISRLHVTLLSCEPENHMVENIGKEVFLPDEFCIIGKTIYLFCPNGYGNTKLHNTFFEKKLRVQATTRNWKTVLELLKMSE